MNFIDHTGHIFSIEHYATYPMGYEFDECPYTFWMNDDYSSQLSVDCFYIKPIRIITSESIDSIEISIKNSKHFRLLGSKKIEELVRANKNPLDEIQLDFATDEAEEYWNTLSEEEQIRERKNDFKSLLKFSNSSEDNDLLVVRNLYCDNYFYRNENTNKEVQVINESDIINLTYDNVKDYSLDEKIRFIKTLIDKNFIFFNYAIRISPTKLIDNTAPEFNDTTNSILNSVFYSIKNEFSKKQLVDQINFIERNEWLRQFVDLSSFEEKTDEEKKEDISNGLNEASLRFLAMDIYEKEATLYLIGNIDLDSLSGLTTNDKENCTKKLLESYLTTYKNSYKNLSNDEKFLLIKESKDTLLDANNLEKYTAEEIDKEFERLGFVKSEIKFADVNGQLQNVYKHSINYSMIPFYVIGTASEFGSWSTNVLIKLTTKDYTTQYCPITVGGTFINEFEELTINAKNMGISLPKDICRALYNSSFWNEVPNLSLWNQKIKEYLINYMKLHGERGNFQSAISALKWFGWGDKIKISSLIQTDNEFIEQYILNNFDIMTDVIQEFMHFRNSTLISLYIPGVVESDEINKMDFDKDFWGEGKPKTKNLFEETEVVHYDESDIDFIRPVYDWAFNELAIKLCCLKYYYQKYFLPIHLYIHRASITHQCFAPDVKLLASAKTMISENLIYAAQEEVKVEFPKSNIVWLNDQCRLVDENWIEDLNAQNKVNVDNVDTYYFDIIDNCFNVPIKLVQKKFNSEKPEQIFDCKLFAYQDNKLMKEAAFTLCSDKKEYIINFVIYPKILNENYDINFWLERDYFIRILCNGNWYEYKFKIGVPELDIEVGKLIYKYNHDICKQFSGYDGNMPMFNVSMYLPDLALVNNIDFIGDLCEYARQENVGYIEENIFEDEITSDKIYYYCFDDNGNKTLLSSGTHTLVKEDDKYVIKENKYVLKQNGEYPEDLAKIIDRSVYISVYKNIYSFINLYSIQTQVPSNNKFLNKVHIFDVLTQEKDNEGNYTGNYSKLRYSSDDYGTTSRDLKQFPILRENNEGNIVISYEDLTFGDNDSELVKDVYGNIFDENGEWSKELKYWDGENWIETDNEQRKFDIYLMHDFDYWYAIMISKQTIGNSYEDLTTIQKIYSSGEFTLEHKRSDEKILVNRMEYQNMNGVYHFNPNDMIVAKLNQFNSLPFKLKIGSRWNFYPLGVGSTIKQSFESPTNIGIMSIGKTDLKHSEGYYAVQVNYSIDNFTNYNQERKTRILISDKY